MTLDAFWLPGLDEGDVADWESRDLGGGVSVRWPRLDAPALRRVIAHLAAQRERVLARTPLHDIVRALDAAAARLADPADALRRAAESALPAVTGYHPAMVRLVLDRMAADWRAPALERLLRAELRDPAALDGFVPDPAAPGRRVRAAGPELTFHVFAGNVPGVAVTSLVRALLVRSASLGKTAAGEPVLAPLFARALESVAPDLARCMAVTYWQGGDLELEDAALEAADAVVVYGGEDALRALGGRVRPGTRLLDHGPRYSFGVVTREALAAGRAQATAGAIARAVAAFDQQGCVSPHVVYAEDHGDVAPRELARLVAASLAELERELPRGRISHAEAAAIHEARGAAEFRAIAGEDVLLHEPEGAGTAFTVVYDPQPGFATSCLNRFLWVKPLPDALDVVGQVRPYRAYLQTVALAGAQPRLVALADALARAGVTRITSFEAAPWPPPEWHHDGRGPLNELLRWTDWETHGMSGS